MTNINITNFRKDIYELLEQTINIMNQLISLQKTEMQLFYQKKIIMDLWKQYTY